MGKRVNPRERITQRTVGVKNRQADFLNWALENKPTFDFNRLVRDKLDEQIDLLAPEFLEDEKKIE